MTGLRVMIATAGLCVITGPVPAADPAEAGRPFDGPMGLYLAPDFGVTPAAPAAPGMTPLGGWGDATGMGAPLGYQGLSPAAAGFVTGQWGAPPATPAPAPTPWSAPAAGWWGGAGGAQLPQDTPMWGQPGPAAPQAPAGAMFTPFVTWQSAGGQDPTLGGAGAWQPFGTPPMPATPEAMPGGMWLTPPTVAPPSQPGMTWSAPGGWGQGMWYEAAPTAVPAANPWQPAATFPSQALGAPLGAPTAPQTPHPMFTTPGTLAPTPWAPSAPQQEGFSGMLAPQPYDMTAPAQGGALAPNPWVTAGPAPVQPQTPAQPGAATAPMGPLWVQPGLLQPGTFAPMSAQPPAGSVPGVIQAPTAGTGTDWWQRMTIPTPQAATDSATQPQGATAPGPWAPIQLEPPAPPTAGQWTIPATQ